MSRNARLSVVYGLIILGPAIAVTLPALRYEPGLRLLGDVYIIAAAGLASIGACIYLLSPGGARALDVGWRLRFSAIPWLVVAAGALLIANLDINEPRLQHRQILNDHSLEVLVYEKVCFPPDGRTECRDYTNFVYVRRLYSPVLVLKARVKYIVSGIRAGTNRIYLDPDHKRGTTGIPLP